MFDPLSLCLQVTRVEKCFQVPREAQLSWRSFIGDLSRMSTIYFAQQVLDRSPSIPVLWCINRGLWVAAYIVHDHWSSLVSAKAMVVPLKKKNSSHLELMAVFLTLVYRWSWTTARNFTLPICKWPWMLKSYFLGFCHSPWTVRTFLQEIDSRTSCKWSIDWTCSINLNLT